MQLVASVLESDVAAFSATASKLTALPGVKQLQVDFADGMFVDNTLLSVEELPPLSPAFRWEAHLMLHAPHGFEAYAAAGFSCVIVHLEAYDAAADVRSALESISSLGLEAGLCLKVETRVARAAEFFPYLSRVQLMAIEPGRQGNPFKSEVLANIRELRSAFSRGIIEIDGAMGEKTLPLVKEAGADYAVLGSVLTKVPDALSAWQHLKQIVD